LEVKMRIWDIPADRLCRQYLLGEHREVHAIWVVWTQGIKRHFNNPEIKRWQGKLKALYDRHEEEVEEMIKRGYQHHSPLDPTQASGIGVQDELVYTIDEQITTLKRRGCECRV
jgi:hypothetical protein